MKLIKIQRIKIFGAWEIFVDGVKKKQFGAPLASDIYIKGFKDAIEYCGHTVEILPPGGKQK